MNATTLLLCLFLAAHAFARAPEDNAFDGLSDIDNTILPNAGDKKENPTGLIERSASVSDLGSATGKNSDDDELQVSDFQEAIQHSHSAVDQNTEVQEGRNEQKVEKAGFGIRSAPAARPRKSGARKAGKKGLIGLKNKKIKSFKGNKKSKLVKAKKGKAAPKKAMSVKKGHSRGKKVAPHKKTPIAKKGKGKKRLQKKIAVKAKKGKGKKHSMKKSGAGAKPTKARKGAAHQRKSAPVKKLKGKKVGPIRKSGPGGRIRKGKKPAKSNKPAAEAKKEEHAKEDAPKESTPHAKKEGTANF